MLSPKRACPHRRLPSAASPCPLPTAVCPPALCLLPTALCSFCHYKRCIPAAADQGTFCDCDLVVKHERLACVVNQGQAKWGVPGALACLILAAWARAREKERHGELDDATQAIQGKNELVDTARAPHARRSIHKWHRPVSEHAVRP